MIPLVGKILLATTILIAKNDKLINSDKNKQSLYFSSIFVLRDCTSIIYNLSFYFPVDGGLSEWSDWSKCSKSCDGGEQERTRTCTNPAPQYGGAGCVGHTNEKGTCNTQHCPQVLPPRKNDQRMF